MVLARLELRPFTARDAPVAHADVYGDPDVMRYVAEGPLPDEATTAMLVRTYAQRARINDWTFWAVIERSTGALIGDAGVWPSGRGEAELGYTLARRAWGKGYATEATHAVVDLAFGAFGIDELIALVHPANAASIRVLSKLGFDPAGTRTAWGYEHLLFRLTGAPA
jgi:RimJ/RimL family protein N-acetyltransferase